METVIALSNFEHYGRKRRGEEFAVSAIEARELVTAGLVKIKVAKQAPEQPKQEVKPRKRKAKE